MCSRLASVQITIYILYATDMSLLNYNLIVACFWYSEAYKSELYKYKQTTSNKSVPRVYLAILLFSTIKPK